MVLDRSTSRVRPASQANIGLLYGRKKEGFYEVLRASHCTRAEFFDCHRESIRVLWNEYPATASLPLSGIQLGAVKG